MGAAQKTAAGSASCWLGSREAPVFSEPVFLGYKQPESSQIPSSSCLGPPEIFDCPSKFALQTER